MIHCSKVQEVIVEKRCSSSLSVSPDVGSDHDNSDAEEDLDDNFFSALLWDSSTKAFVTLIFNLFWQIPLLGNWVVESAHGAVSGRWPGRVRARGSSGVPATGGHPGLYQSHCARPEAAVHLQVQDDCIKSLHVKTLILIPTALHEQHSSYSLHSHMLWRWQSWRRSQLDHHHDDLYDDRHHTHTHTHTHPNIF